MAPFGSNPHKKGEHVFNDIGGSLENAFQGAVRTERAHAVALTYRHGRLDVQQFPRTIQCLRQLCNDPIIRDARTVVAPPTGLHDDINSRAYGQARWKLENTLADVVIATGALVWKKRPRQSSSSFHELESVIAGIRSSGILQADAMAAISVLIDSARDPKAEASALSERVSDTELKRRRGAVASMKQHLSELKRVGHALVATFVYELEREFERRLHGLVD